MILEVFADNLQKEDINMEIFREGCRGIVLKDNLILTVRLIKDNTYTLPGGGLEQNETKKECVVREILEETGVKTKVVKDTLTIKEYFDDSTWFHNFFLCEVVEETNIQSLTKEEQELGLEIKWIDLMEFLDLLVNNESNHPYGSNIQSRELMGVINSI